MDRVKNQKLRKLKAEMGIRVKGTTDCGTS